MKPLGFGCYIDVFQTGHSICVVELLVIDKIITHMPHPLIRLT